MAAIEGKVVRILTGLFLLGAVSGCASLGTFNPATGRQEFIVIPTESEVVMGQDMHGKLAQQYRIVNSGAEAERVRKIGQRVAAVSDRKDYTYQFYLIDTDELNAFTVPGGRVYIFSGLVKKLDNDDEIAAVLAHEVGHCAARHTIKKFQAAVAYDVIGGVLLGSLGLEAQVQQIISLSSDAVSSLVFSAYSRRDEFEADRLGLKYVMAAGYDPWGLVRTLDAIEQESRGARIPLFLRTHPYVHDRIEAIKARIAVLEAQEPAAEPGR